MREKLLALLLDLIIKLDLMPRKGFGQIIIQIQDYKVVSADVYKENIKF